MEEEEDVQKRKVAIVAAAHAAAASAMASAYMLMNIPKEPYIDRNDDRRRYMQLILKNDRKCRHNLLMGEETFYRLCELIRRQGDIDDSENCTLEEMLMRFLHMIGHNVRHRVIEGRFYRSGETISRQFNEVLDCVINLYGSLVANHLEEVHRSGTSPEITNDPRFASYFKGCLGALDGTHIVANVPIEEQDRYRGRKLIPTQNVLAACSFDLKFTYVLVGWEGTAHDQKVLDDAFTRSNPFVVPRGKYYLVDGGYTHQPGFLAPYRGVSYHLGSTKGRTPLNEKEIFNKRHSHLRNAIERAFGVLKKRWAILSNEAFYPYKTQVKIALACFVLHNHIMGVDPNDSFFREVDKELENATPEDIDEPPQSSSTSQKAAWVQVLVIHRFHNKMASGKERNVNDNPDSSDKCINLTRERATDYPIPQYGVYDPHVYFPPLPQHHGFRPYQTNYLRRPGGYPPASQPLPGYSFPSYSDPIIIGGDHGWGEYREGEDSISKHRTEKNVDDDSEGSMKIEDRKGQLRWNATMDDILFNILGEAARKGKKSGKKWDTTVWNDLIAALSEKTIEKMKSSHIENRLRQMRKEYVNFMALRGKSGVSYDRIKQMIVAPQGFWDDILSNSANEKKYKAFRERGPKWDLEKLCTVIGDSHAIGSYALGGLDKVERKDDLPGPDESIDLDDDTISSVSTKNTNLKRQHGKKTRAVDEVKGMLQGVTDHLEKLRETVDPLSFGRTLREAVMGVVGFDQRSKNTAFKLLMKNRQDAEFFVLTDEEGRKDMFIDMGIE